MTMRGIGTTTAVALLLAAGPPLLAQSGAPESPEPLALFDAMFYGRGANVLEAGDPASAIVATRVLRDGLGSTGRFRLIDSATLASTLRAQEANGLECYTMACRQMVAARVGARWMVTSKVSKTSNLIWYLSGQFTEVPTGRRLLDDEFEIKGKHEEIVPQGAQSLVRRIERAVERAERGLAMARVRNPSAAREAEDLDRELRVRLADVPGIDLLPEAKFPASAKALDPACNTTCLREEARTAGARWMLLPTLRRDASGRWILEADTWSIGEKEPLRHESVPFVGPVTIESVESAARSLAERFGTFPPIASLALVPSDTPPAPLTLDELKRRLDASTPSNPANLSGADLRALDLTGLDFRQAILVGADLREGKLSGVNCFACDLTDAKLNRADLRKANLDGSTLRRADMRGANLQNASLFATIIEQAQLDSANLSGARIIGYLRKATLRGASLVGGDIGADMGNQSMGVMRANFSGADLSGADLTNANLFKADFSYATLHNAKLTGADLRNSELIGTDLTGADLTDAKLDLANVSGTILKDVKGKDSIQGLANTRNRDKAVW